MQGNTVRVSTNCSCAAAGNLRRCRRRERALADQDCGGWALVCRLKAPHFRQSLLLRRRGLLRVLDMDKYGREFILSLNRAGMFIG